MEYKIKDLIEDIIDNRGKNPNEYITFSEYPIIDNYLIKGEYYPDLKNVNRYISKETYKSFIRNYSKKNDVLITMVGNGIGNVTLMPNDNAEIIQNTIGLRCKPDLLLNEYLFYYLKNIKDMLKGLNRGSSQPSISKNDLLDIKILLPKLSIQKKIVSILSSIDLKIHNNKCIINSLENIFSTLFEQYFLKFDFPNDQGLPYHSSGGEMCESELGEIPQSWFVGKIEDVCILKKDKTNLNKVEEIFSYIGLEHMPQGSIALNEWENSEKVSGIKSRYNKGDILFGKLRPYFKKVGIAPIEGVCSTDILVLRPKNSVEYGFLIGQLIQDKFIDYTSRTATGTRMPRSGWNQISNYKIVIPTNEVLEKFNLTVLPMLKIIQNKIYENKNLKDLRDSLIPKLLSGEIGNLDESVVD